MVGQCSWSCRSLAALVFMTGLDLVTGCRQPQAPPVARPSVTPATQPAGSAVRLAGTGIKPMYTELLAIDLPTALRVARAQNLDIQEARQSVLISRGQYESTVGSAFPAIVPTGLFEHVEGAVRASPGNQIQVGFDSFQFSGAIQWVINPPRVIYEIVAARKRLGATELQEQSTILETLRRSALQFYDLALAQARVAAAQQAVTEAEELLRINTLRLRTGTGTPADELRARARRAERQQDLVNAIRAFYDASVALATTLRLHPTVTLVPHVEDVRPITLVEEDLHVQDLLALAAEHRPDLASVRTRIEAAAAALGATWWGAFGPQFQLGYEVGGLMGNSKHTKPPQGIPANLIVNPTSSTGAFSSNPVANGVIKELISRGAQRLEGAQNQTFGAHETERGSAGYDWRLSPSAFGDLKSGNAIAVQAVLEAERQLDQVGAQVVSAQQASHTNFALIGLAQEQVTSAAEALRLAQKGLDVGTMTTLDVLQAQDAAAQARLRFADAVVHYNQSQVDLLGALGLLDETSLTPNLDATSRPILVE